MEYLALTLPGGRNVQAPGELPDGGLDTLSNAVSVGISWMIIIAVILALFFLITGGIQWSASGGDKGKIAAARARITYAVIGMIVAVTAFFIISVFGNFFGVELLGSGN